MVSLNAVDNHPRVKFGHRGAGTRRYVRRAKGVVFVIDLLPDLVRNAFRVCG